MWIEDFICLREELTRLQREKSAGSIEDLVKLGYMQIDVYRKAMADNKLNPYKELNENFLGQITELRKDISRTRLKNIENIEYKGFKIKVEFPGQTTTEILITPQEINNAIGLTNKLIESYEEYSIQFTNMKNCLMKHIELEILPNKSLDNESIYLGRGKVVMPAKIKTEGYHVFDISVERCLTHKTDEVRLMPLTEHGLKTIEEALERYAEPDTIETLAVARNTEHYPLTETAIPIIRKKYEEGLWGKR